MRLRHLIAAATIVASIHIHAAEETYGPYKAQVIRVKDGDTVLLDVRIWPGLTQRISLRLDGVNTPEKRGKGVTECEKKAGQKATNFTQRFLKGVETVIVRGVRRGKYAGRVLGRIEVPGKGDLGQALIRAGLARPYDGGKRAPWCTVTGS